MEARPDDVDRIVAWLEQHRAEIARLEFGRISFDVGAGDIKARIERTERLPPIERKSAQVLPCS